MNQREKSPLLNLERNSETNDSPNTIKVGGKQNICYFDNDFEGSLCGADKEVSEWGSHEKTDPPPADDVHFYRSCVLEHWYGT